MRDLKDIELINDSQIMEACEKAYKESAHNAYFANGFNKGVVFALEKCKVYEMLDMLQNCKEYFLLKTDKYSEEKAEAIGQLIKEATEL
jgi:hypothetical protein